jgi:hypothetical protein
MGKSALCSNLYQPSGFLTVFTHHTSSPSLRSLPTDSRKPVPQEDMGKSTRCSNLYQPSGLLTVFTHHTSSSFFESLPADSRKPVCSRLRRIWGRGGYAAIFTSHLSSLYPRIQESQFALASEGYGEEYAMQQSLPACGPFGSLHPPHIFTISQVFTQGCKKASLLSPQEDTGKSTLHNNLYKPSGLLTAFTHHTSLPF